MIYLYQLLICLIFLLPLGLFGQEKEFIEEIMTKNKELNLEEYDGGKTYELFGKLVTNTDKEQFEMLINGEWNYAYSIKPDGRKYKVKNPYVRFSFDKDHNYLALKKRDEALDSIKGNWSFGHGILTLRFSEPYFKNGKPEDLDSMDDYSRSLISLDNEIHMIFKITEDYLIIVNSINSKVNPKNDSMRFRLYRKSNG